VCVCVCAFVCVERLKNRYWRFSAMHSSPMVNTLSRAHTKTYTLSLALSLSLALPVFLSMFTHTHIYKQREREIHKMVLSHLYSHFLNGVFISYVYMYVYVIAIHYLLMHFRTKEKKWGVPCMKASCHIQIFLLGQYNAKYVCTM